MQNYPCQMDCRLPGGCARIAQTEVEVTRVVFMGTPDFAVPSLSALLSVGYLIVGVLTRADQPAGRGQRLEESAVKQFARAEGLAVQQPRTLRSAQAQEALAALAPDLIVVAAYGLLLPQPVLDLPPYGCINVHGSLLPRHRGAAPIAAAILAGDAETGITIMRMDAGLDTGPVLAAEALPIAPDDTTGTLTAKLAALGARLLIQTLPRWLRSEIQPQPQNEQLATFAPRIEKGAGEINWREPAEIIERRVRAYQPWPSAFTTWQGQRLKVVRATASSEGRAGEVGEVYSAGADTYSAVSHRTGVITGHGTLWLNELQLAGKRPLPIEAFLRGAPGFVGSRLG